MPAKNRNRREGSGFDSKEEALEYAEKQNSEVFGNFSTVCKAEKVEKIEEVKTVTRVGRGPKESLRFEAHIHENLFPKGSRFSWRGKDFVVENSGKPSAVGGGEAKTDVYIAVRDEDSGEVSEFKLSLKQDDADFIENKPSPDRLRAVYGENMESKMKKSLDNLFLRLQETGAAEKTLKPEKGQKTLGCRFDVVRKPRTLSTPLDLSEDEEFELYSGEKLPDSKLNSSIDGVVVPGCGAASHMLEGRREDYSTPQSVLDAAVPIREYVKNPDRPKLYGIFGAINAFNVDNKLKFEGRRALAATVHHDKDGNASFDLHPNMDVFSTDFAESLGTELSLIGLPENPERHSRKSR